METEEYTRILLDSLLATKYRELTGKKFRLDVRESSGQKLGVVITNNPLFMETDYTIEAVFPRDILEHPERSSILLGFLGHELSHAANGDFSILTKRALRACGFFGLEDIFRKRRERYADRDAISRGLGEEIYLSRVYEEKTNCLSDGLHYSSFEIKELMEKQGGNCRLP